MEDKLISLNDIGKLVFGSAEEFNTWLAEPAFGLSGQIPKRLLDTSAGAELVAQELAQIEYGDLA